MADDDSFVHVLNLFLFLSDKKPKEPVAYGHHFLGHPDFLSGGASFVFSRKAYKRLIEKLKKNSCPNSQKGEGDYDLFKCLNSVGVRIGDSTDEFGLERFHSRSFEKHFQDYPKQGMSNHKQYVNFINILLNIIIRI
jgi:glycoprotein-N-acetylgalactosamine 3-beta-galactosyltransferase